MHSYWAVLFHDFGKVCSNFQDSLPPQKSGWKDRRIRHEFVSGSFMVFAYKESILLKQPLGALAVYSHHKPLTDQLFQADANQQLILPIREYHHLIKVFEEKSKNAGYPIIAPAASIEAFGKATCANMYHKVFSVLLKDISLKFNSTHRREYIIFKALLNISDWLGSSHRNLSPGLRYTPESLKNKIEQKLHAEGKNIEIRYSDFQKNSRIPGSVIAIAPTGSGKTEAALLWASQKNAFEKIIYLLPTKVTSNAIFLRLAKYFGEENCGIVHSSARLFLKEMNLDEGRKYILDRTFFKEVTVCTVDQVLTQGFNLGFWEIKTFHLFKANVIIDEVHLYQPYTLALIIETVKYLRTEFQTRFFIMTATMPQKLLSLLCSALDIGHENVVRDVQLLEAARNIFEVRNGIIDDLNDEIQYYLQNNKKVLIVVNTVDEAIRIYKKYSEDIPNSICFHSRFIQKDRLEKEKKILEIEKSGEPVLLVATQVVEVSLDIDYDVLFTENAPMDALIQRAGRVNRSRSKQDSRVIVFQHRPVSEEKIYPREILENTFSLLSERSGKRLPEKELTELVDLVYKNYDVELDEAFIRGKHAYAEVQSRLNFIKDNEELDAVYTREGLDSVNVIPMKFEEDLSDKDEIQKSNHEVMIRRSNLWRGKISKDQKHNFFKYFDCEYDSNTGLQFLSRPTAHVSGGGITKSY